MNSIPKPQPCDQSWSNMHPVAGGRRCGKCQKTIVDFSQKTWAEIEAMKRAHGPGLCGLYHPGQLEYWGREVPRAGCGSFARTLAFLGSLSLSQPALSQTDSLPAMRYPEVFTGVVFTAGDSLPSRPLAGAKILLQGTPVQTVSDSAGRFSLHIDGAADTLWQFKPTIMVWQNGFDSEAIFLEKSHEPAMRRDFYLNAAEPMEIMDFSVRANFWTRLTWRIRRWFR